VLSVVLSFRNEAEVIPELLRRLSGVLAAIGGESEIIFVNDASTDGSLPLLADAARTDPRLRVITMSRRFGPAECALAGLEFSRGDAVILMDADLQDPPELIPTLVARWREGADVVYTVRTRRRGEPAAKMLLMRAAYRLLHRLSGGDLPVEAGDFRLMSRRVVDQLVALREREPYLRGLAAWVGFRQVAVPYERQARYAGRTHFPLFGSWNPARTFFAGLTSFSVAPLAVFLPIGVAVLLAAGTAAAAVLIVPGWRAAASAPLMIGLAVGVLAGIQIAGIGILGLYIARIHADVRARPRYIVDNVISTSPADVLPGPERT